MITRGNAVHDASGVTERFLVLFCIGLATLIAPASYAQIHKCEDGGGRVSYGEQSCPKAVMSSSVGQPGQHKSGNTESGLAGDGQPQLPNQSANSCANKWLLLLQSIALYRDHASKMLSQGGRDAMKEMETRRTSEFLRSCARFGFVMPDSLARVAKNTALGVRIKQEFQVMYERRVTWETARRVLQGDDRNATTQHGIGQKATVSPLSPTDRPQMTWCADEWESEAKEYIQHTTEGRSHGRDTSAYDMFMKEREQNVMARFLPKCGKYGFVYPRNQSAVDRNGQVLERLRKRLAAEEIARTQAELREAIDREAEYRARALQQIPGRDPSGPNSSSNEK